MRSRFAILLAIAVVCVTTAMAEWTSESLVTGSSCVTRLLYGQHLVVFGTDGVGHLVWEGGPLNIPYPNNLGIWYNRYNPGSGWTADFGVAPATKKSLGVIRGLPCIALDGDGRTVHVVWHAGEDTTINDSICYRRCRQDKRGNDKWDAVVPLYVGEHARGPVVACVPDEPNHVLVCWTAYVGAESGYPHQIRFREYVNGAWTQVVRLDSIYRTPQRLVAIAAAPNGDVFVAFRGYEAPGAPLQMFVKTRINGVWGEKVDVAPGFTRYDWEPALEVSPLTNNPHLAFRRWWVVPNGEGEDTLAAAYHTFRNASGEWLTPEVISEPRRAYYGDNPTMAFFNDGAAYVAWYDSFPPASRGIMYSCCSSEGGAWSAPAWLTTSPSAASYPAYLAVEEPAHSIHAVWHRYVGSGVAQGQIWWQSDYSGGGGSQAQPVALSQSRIELFPNPAKAGRVTVQYTLPRAEPLRVTLLDVSGRAVRTLEVATTGTSGAFGIDASGLTAGVYIVKLESGSASQTRKLVIQ